MAIGDRCQSSKTYLEKNFDGFAGLNGDQLIQHGIKALRASAQDTELTENNVSIGIVGKGQDWKTFSPEELRAALASAAPEEEKM